MDSYGWSSRWRRELSGESSILKSTIYVRMTHTDSTASRAATRPSGELYANHMPPMPYAGQEQIVRWHHFVSSRYDSLGLFDIMSFFTNTRWQRDEVG